MRVGSALALAGLGDGAWGVGWAFWGRRMCRPRRGCRDGGRSALTVGSRLGRCRQEREQEQCSWGGGVSGAAAGLGPWPPFPRPGIKVLTLESGRSSRGGSFVRAFRDMRLVRLPGAPGPGGRQRCGPWQTPASAVPTAAGAHAPRQRAVQQQDQAWGPQPVAVPAPRSL